MEWFKHKTNSLDDPDFSAIIDEFGSDGYMMFFGLLEIYGREYSNTDSEQFLNIRLAFVARKLRKSSAKVRKFLNFCEKLISKPRFEHSINGVILSYKAPGFIELSSNWTKRKEEQPTEAPMEAPTAIRSRSRSKKKNKEKDIQYPEWLDLDLWKTFITHRNGTKPKLSHHAEILNINKLKKLIDKGHDQTEIINQTIERGWKGLFEPKEDFNKTNNPYELKFNETR